MRCWRNTWWTVPDDMTDEALAEVAQHGHPYAPHAWLSEAFAEWCDRGKPLDELADGEQRRGAS